MTGLIIEGGARRGIFTAGITDCLLENKIHFDYVAGVSAGAEVALDFTAKQEGRSRKVIMPHRTDDFSVLGFLSMDLDNMIYRFPYQDYPFDFDTFFASDTNCEFVATDCVTGKAKYFSENKSEQRLLDSVRASCTVPILYQISEFEGGKYVDGSIADAVPFDRAFEQGCSRVLVLLTKPENEPCTDYRKFEFLINKKYKDYPNLINALMTRFDRYNEQCKRMKQLEEDGILMVLRPSHKYVKSFEMNTDVLDEAYNAGKNLAKEKLAEIEDFLNVLEKK